MAGGRARGRWQRLDEVVDKRGTATKLVPPTTALEPRRLSLQWHRQFLLLCFSRAAGLLPRRSTRSQSTPVWYLVPSYYVGSRRQGAWRRPGMLDVRVSLWWSMPRKRATSSSHKINCQGRMLARWLTPSIVSHSGSE